MLYQLLVSLFVINCFLLILIILVQQGKGNMGLGNLGGATQMIFGGSGGADIFQKITWVLGAIFMAGSLMLALMRNNYLFSARYVPSAVRSVEQRPAQQMPVE